MGMFDKKQTGPAGYSSHGHQPSAQAGDVLTESRVHLDALDRAQNARELTPTEPSQEPIIPIVRTETKAPDEWNAETFIIPAGKVVQILGRDEQRATADVTNQTNLENVAGNGTAVYLFRSQGEAQSFVNATPQPTAGRFAVLPDGAARGMKHTGSVWACIRANAVGSAIVDVTVERYRGARP